MFATLRRFFGTDPHANLRQLLGDQPLPSFPETTQQVLAALRDPDASLATIGTKLAADPGLTVDVLRTVNSAAYGLRRPINDAAHATRMLGRSELESLVLSRAVRAALPTRRVPGFDPARFWADAARRAAFARALAQATEPAAARLAYTASLLQDIAVPLLAQADVPAYRAVLAEGWSPGTSLLQAERARLDFDHALVCGWLCDAWSFPEPLSRAITHHHDEQAPLSVRVAAELERGEADLDRVVAAAESLLTMPADRTLALWSESSDPERTAA